MLGYRGFKQCGKRFVVFVVYSILFFSPPQSGSPLVGATCPYKHFAVFPTRLRNPRGQLSFRVVPCTTGSAGTVKT